jgi:hypothetical protein
MTAAVVVTLAAASCGSSGGMSDAARQKLDALVGQVRAAAIARDRPQAKHALGSLRHWVHEFQQDGQIGSGRATDILAAAATVEAHLAPYATTPTTTTTTTVPEPDEHHEPDKHHGKDKGPKGD